MKDKTLLLVFSYLRPFGRRLPLVIALGMAAYLSEGLGIGLLVPLFGVLTHAPASSGSALFDLFRSVSPGARLLLICAAIAGLLAAKLALMWGTLSLSGSIARRANEDLRASLYRRLLDCDYAYIVNTERGQILNLFDTLSIRALEATIGAMDLMVTLCAAAIFGALMLLASWQMTLAVAALALAARFALGRRVLRFVHRLGEAEARLFAAYTQHVLGSVLGMRMIRAYGQEAREAATFADRSRAVGGIVFRLWRAQRLTPTALEVAYAPAFLGAVLIAWRLGFDPPVFLAFLVLLLRLQMHVRAIDAKRTELAGCAGALRQIADFLGPANAPTTRSGPLPVERLYGSIEFKSVGFRFPSRSGDEPALADVSFTLRAGTMTAIIGESGAGKSTLINLLLRLYDPTEGEILVDGRPLASLNLAAWRARIATAGQDAMLLDGTISDTIAYACPEADAAAVADAARLAAIDRFIEALPDGYRTEIGDGGIRLSEGQRQRLCLARALLRDADILVLDEATNALDGLTEQVVHEAIDRLRGRRTLIVIAHRLSTIRMADHVIVLSAGRLVEQGAPSALLARNGAFARLCDLEARRAPAAVQAE